MIRKLFFIISLLGLSATIIQAQSVTRTGDLFRRGGADSDAGQLNIIQDTAIDTLISRYRLINENLRREHGYYGMDGFRIQIYSSNNRNAREESNKVRAEFINKFPDIASYPLYDNPGYFKVRVGDFRSKTEATKLYLLISREFPDAYIIPNCFINFPDRKTK